MDISYKLQTGQPVCSFTAEEIAAAQAMYDYVVEHSGNFTCHYAYLRVLWEAAYIRHGQNIF